MLLQNTVANSIDKIIRIIKRMENKLDFHMEKLGHKEEYDNNKKQKDVFEYDKRMKMALNNINDKELMKEVRAHYIGKIIPRDGLVLYKTKDKVRWVYLR